MTDSVHARAAPNPDFAGATIRFIMDMAIAAHLGFRITDIGPGSIEITQPYRISLWR